MKISFRYIFATQSVLVNCILLSFIQMQLYAYIDQYPFFIEWRHEDVLQVHLCPINQYPSRFILNRYSFTKLKMREMREWSLKTIICLSCWHNTLKGNDQYKGATLCLKGKLILSRKKEETFLQQGKGVLWFIKGSLILPINNTKCLMNDPLKLYGEIENL